MFILFDYFSIEHKLLFSFSINVKYKKILENDCYCKKYCEKSRLKKDSKIIFTLPNDKIKFNKTLSVSENKKTIIV